MAAKFREQNEVAVNSFATAQYNNITGFVANTQQAAIDRLKSSAEEGVSVCEWSRRRV